MMTKMGLDSKHSNSLLDLNRQAQLTRELTRQLIIKTSNFSIFFSMFMGNSSGKDKFIALFQYLFQFFCACGENSSIPGIASAYKQGTPHATAGKLPDMLVYYNLKENLSSARKVFRLFRFFDNIKELVRVVGSNRPASFKVLFALTSLCSALYYISDNILWTLNILARSKVTSKSISNDWKRRKNFFSLCRVVALAFSLVNTLHLQTKENAANIAYFSQQDESNENIPEQTKVAQKLIEGRRKNRFSLLQLVLSILRFIMLTKSLRLTGHQFIDPVFVGVCGLVSSSLDFFKAITEKTLVLNVGEEDSGKPPVKNTSMFKHIRSVGDLDNK